MLVRKLNAEDWRAYKDLRLEALKLHSENFGSSHDEEAKKTDEDWRTIMSGEGYQRFGLFNENEEMVGIGGVLSHLDDSQTAILVAGYIRELYRGKGYSRLLYQHRIQWSIDSGLFKRILVGHHEGNEASRRANQAFGFEYIGKEEKTFGNGAKAIEYQYEMRLA